MFRWTRFEAPLWSTPRPTTSLNRQRLSRSTLSSVQPANKSTCTMKSPGRSWNVSSKVITVSSRSPLKRKLKWAHRGLHRKLYMLSIRSFDVSGSNCCFRNLNFTPWQDNRSVVDISSVPDLPLSQDIRQLNVFWIL